MIHPPKNKWNKMVVHQGAKMAHLVAKRPQIVYWEVDRNTIANATIFSSSWRLSVVLIVHPRQVWNIAWVYVLFSTLHSQLFARTLCKSWPWRVTNAFSCFSGAPNCQNRNVQALSFAGLICTRICAFKTQTYRVPCKKSWWSLLARTILDIDDAIDPSRLKPGVRFIHLKKSLAWVLGNIFAKVVANILIPSPSTPLADWL